MERDSAFEKRSDKLGPRVADAFRRRHFEAYYCATVQEALEKAVELIPKDDVVSWAGSETIREIGLVDYIRKNGYKRLDQEDGKDRAEFMEITRRATTCDTYLMSSNGASEDGQLVNIDRTGNRVAALCYGPKNVIVILGMNKVVKTAEDALARARGIAAPVNMARFAGRVFPEGCTPCAVTGTCADCTTEQYCICSQIVTTRHCCPTGRIKVILVGEKLGF